MGCISEDAHTDLDVCVEFFFFRVYNTCTVHIIIYSAQILIKIIAFRLKYFTHKFEVFDGIVVVISWTLDVASMYVIA